MLTKKVTVGAASLVLMLAGCANTNSATDVASGPAPTITAASQIKLPLTSYMLSRDEEVLFNQAVEKEKAKCAKRFGVDYSPYVVEESSLNSSEDTYSRRYWNLYPENVPIYGYGQPAKPGSSGDRKPEADSSPLYQEVMLGKTADGKQSTLKDKDGNPLPEFGCATEGFRAIWGSDGYTWSSLPESLLNESFNKLLEHPDFITLESEWSQCMTDKGYDFIHRADAGNSTVGMTKEQTIVVAEADLACAQKTNYDGRAYAIDVAIQNQLINDHESELRGVLDAKQRIMQRAKDTLR